MLETFYFAAMFAHIQLSRLTADVQWPASTPFPEALGEKKKWQQF